MKRLILLVALVNVLSPFNARRATAQVILSDDWTGSEFGGVRNWSLISSRERVEFLGTIYKKRWWDCWYCDDDLNMLVRPDGAYDFVTRNRSERRNRRRDNFIDERGLIELEIRTDPEVFDAVIRAGMRVWAKGWWVQDSGHDDKTELHPLQILIGTNGADPLSADSFSVFIGQDTSGRFTVSENTYLQQVSVPIGNFLDVVRVERTQTMPDATFGSVYERSRISVGNYRVIHRQYPELSVLDVLIALAPHFGTLPYSPAYAAEFSRSQSFGFKDKSQYRVATIGGQKAVEILVSPEFPNWGLVTSRWILEDWSAPGGYQQINNPTPPNRTNFTLRYSPVLGLSQTSWTLSASSDDRGPAHFPLDSFADRRYYQKSRTYEIRPSTITLRGSVDGGWTQNHLGSLFIVPCAPEETVTAREGLLPEIGLVAGTLKLFVKPTLLPPLALTPAPPWKQVTAADPYVSPVVRVSLDPSDDHKLNIVWMVPDLFVANQALDIKVEAQTELGEVLFDQINESARCIPASVVGRSRYDEMMRAVSAYNRYRFLFDFVPKFFEKLFQLTPSVKFEPDRIGDLEEWASDQTEGPRRDELEAFMALNNARSLSHEQAAALDRLAAYGSRIVWNKNTNKTDLDLYIAERLWVASGGNRRRLPYNQE